MKTIKVYSKKFENKNGIPFYSVSVKGKFVKSALAKDDIYYNVKFVKGSTAVAIDNEGCYEVAYEDNGLWIDQRPDFIDKNILRIKAVKAVKID